jgi:hypothetical protein
MSIRAWLWPLLAVGATGCYTYAPLPDQRPVAPADVRVLVSREFRQEWPDVVGRGRRALEGRVLEWDESAVLLEVPLAGIPSGGAPRPLAQRFIVPWSEVLELEVKRLDRGKTAAAIVGVGAAALLVRQLLFAGKTTGGNEEPGEPGDQDFVLVPLISR